MQKAVRHYIKGRTDYLSDPDIDVGEDYINETFESIQREIDRITGTEVNKARERELRKWRKREKLNRRHNNKKSGRKKR